MDDVAGAAARAAKDYDLIVKEALERAVAKTGPRANYKSAQSYGVAVHNALKEEILALGDPRLRAEVSYRAKDPADYGEPGSVRLDVVLYDESGALAKVWDLKTGAAPLSKSRIREIERHIPDACPIEEICP